MSVKYLTYFLAEMMKKQKLYITSTQKAFQLCTERSYYYTLASLNRKCMGKAASFPTPVAEEIKDGFEVRGRSESSNFNVSSDSIAPDGEIDKKFIFDRHDPDGQNIHTQKCRAWESVLRFARF